jgi:hypothetical protein
MTSTRTPGGVTEVDRPKAAAGPVSRPGEPRRRTRIALLTAAAVILLLGAATAGVFGYLTIVRGGPAAATTGAAAPHR